MWFMPDGTVRYTLDVPPLSLPPAPRRSRRALFVRVAVLIGVFSVLLGGSAAIALNVRSHGGSPRVLGQGSAAASSLNPHATPPPNAPAEVREAWYTSRLRDVAGAQSAALLRGDEAGFVAAIDPGNTGLLTKYRLEYRNLRALHVASWDVTIPAGTVTVDQAVSSTEIHAETQIKVCFFATGCDADPETFSAVWVDDRAGLRLSKLDPDPATGRGPRPWEASDLRVVVGKRAAVATTAQYAGRLSTALAAAEQAGSVTDRYAKWAPPPARYMIFLAGAGEWGSWYGGMADRWAAGYTISATEEVIINEPVMPTSALELTLQHEFTHVVTLAGVRQDFAHTWWLVEGLAEYVMWSGRSVSYYGGLSEVRRFVRSGRWNGDVALDGPGSDASDSDATARYGIAFLAVHRLATRFGEPAMLNFFGQAARFGMDLDVASRTAFKLDWAPIDADCAAYVRSAIQ